MIRNFLVLVAISLLSIANIFSATPPPGNDSWSGALSIGSIPYEHIDNCIDVTNNEGSYSLGTAFINDGVWYKFQPTITATYLLEVTPNQSGVSTWNPAIGFYTAGETPSDAPIIVSITDNFQSGDESPEVATFSLTQGSTYYFNIGASGAFDGLETQCIISFNFAPPDNDACSGAFNIDPNALPYSTTQNAIGATNNDGFLKNADNTAFMNDGVWYKFTPTVTENYRITASPNEWDNEIGIFSGTCNSLLYLQSRDEHGPSSSEVLDIELTAETTYYINIGHYSLSSDINEGEFSLTLSLAPPDNDACSGAFSIDPNALPYSTTQDATEATNNDGFLQSFNISDGVWYKFTPTVTENYRITASPNEWDNKIGIFSGTCDSLLYLQSIDHAYSNNSETIDIELTAEITYYINIGYDSNDPSIEEGEFSLTLNLAPPKNDACSGAFNIDPNTLPYSTTQDATEATNNDGFLTNADNAPFMNDGVWYKFTPTVTENYRITASPNEWNNEIGIFSGTCDSLLYLQSIDENESSSSEILNIELTAGTTYYINIGHYSDNSNINEGEFSLTLNLAPPENDACSGAFNIDPNALPYSTTQNAIGATNNDGFLKNADNAPFMNDGVWYKFTPTVTENYIITTSPNGWDNEISIFSGTCDSLLYLQSIDLYTSSEILNIELTAETTYYINIGHYSQNSDMSEGEFSLTLELAPPAPDNDACSGAFNIDPNALPYSTTQNAIGTTNNDGFLTNADNAPFMNDGVWYKFTPTVTKNYIITASPNGWDNEIGIFSGTCDSLLYLQSIDENESSSSEILNIELTAGTTYYINIGYYSGDLNVNEEEFSLTLEPIILVTGISISPNVVEIPVDNTKQLIATIAPENATDNTVLWTSSDNNIATVDANGLVTAVALGTVTITATSANSLQTANCEITVVDPNDIQIYFHTNQTDGNTIKLGIVADTSDQAAVWIDLNGNQIKDSIEVVTSFNLWSTTDYTINSQEIRIYGNVKEFNCYGNQIDSLNTNQNVNLKELYCSSNQLQSLDVSQNVNLTDLDCSNNQLTSLDASQNQALVYLDCENNALTALNIANGNNVNLEEMYAIDNPTLICIQVDDGFNASSSYWEWEKDDIAQWNNDAANPCGSTALTGLSIMPNELTMGIGGIKQLVAIVEPLNANTAVSWSSSDHNIATVDANGLVTAVALGTATITATSADSLQTADCEITVVDPNNIQIYFHTNQTDGNTIKLGIVADASDQAAVWIDLNGNQIKDSIEVVTSFNLWSTTDYTINSQEIRIYGNVKEFNCYDNQIDSLNTNQNVNLKELYCSSNQLQSLNLSQNVNLKELHCNDNQLHSLDLSQNVNLNSLYCNENQLHSLNLSQNVNLKELYCNDNQLHSLDLSQNVNLNLLYCNKNQLHSLDLSQNVNLNSLYCNENQLHSLNLSQNVNLKELSCNENQLTSLKLTQNQALVYFYCKNNALTALNIANGNNANLTTVNATGNLSLTCIQVDNGFNVSITSWQKDDEAEWNNDAANPCSWLDGVEELYMQQVVKIYPNPVKNVLNIGSEEAILNLNIYNMEGKLVLQIYDRTSVNIDHLPSGFYYIVIRTQQGIYKEKLIKE